jgi:DNA polymerase-1
MNMIIDGSNLLHRSFWVAEKSMNSTDNTVSFIFLKSLRTLIEKFKPSYTWVVWDKKLTSNSLNFRKKLLQDKYKATRDQDRNAKVISHHETLEKLLTALGVLQIYPNVLEADDVISWLTKKLREQCVVVSVDKDLLQLIDENTKVYNPIKKQIINKNNFLNIIGVELKDFIKYKALLGDESDNISGIESFGAVKCKKFCTETVEKLSITLTKEQYDIFERNLKVIDLSNSYNIEKGEVEAYEEQFKQIKKIKPNISLFSDLCKDFGFESIIKDINTWKRCFVSSQKLNDLILSLNS